MPRIRLEICAARNVIMASQEWNDGVISFEQVNDAEDCLRFALHYVPLCALSGLVVLNVAGCHNEGKPELVALLIHVSIWMMKAIKEVQKMFNKTHIPLRLCLEDVMTDTVWPAIRDDLVNATLDFDFAIRLKIYFFDWTYGGFIAGFGHRVSRLEVFLPLINPAVFGNAVRTLPALIPDVDELVFTTDYQRTEENYYDFLQQHETLVLDLFNHPVFNPKSLKHFTMATKATTTTKADKERISKFLSRLRQIVTQRAPYFQSLQMLMYNNAIHYFY